MSAQKIFYVYKEVPVNKWIPANGIEDYFPNGKNYVEFIGETQFTGQLTHINDIDKFSCTAAECVEFKHVDNKYFARVIPAEYECVMCENPDNSIVSARVSNYSSIRWVNVTFKHYGNTIPYVISKNDSITAEEFQAFIKMVSC